VLIAIPVYIFDIFPMGNVLYIENFLSKSNFYLNLSIFDNVPFKLLISYLTSLSLVYIVYFLKSRFSRSLISQRADLVFLFLSILGLMFFMVISSDYYDRYTLPGFVTFLLLVVIIMHRTK